jgi:maltooligosyltrehalose trehalohydrolase
MGPVVALADTLMTAVWKLERGANVCRTAVRFSVWAPNASRVRVRLTNARREHELTHVGDGVFECTVPDIGAGADYGFLLDDGDQLLPDPVSRFQPDGVHGASRVVDPNAFRWTDDAWRGIAMADLVIYELHVGVFTSAGTFAAVISHLRGLRELGVTAIEIMPVAQFPGARNWGYDGVELYAVQNSYGGPDELRRLVDAAHAEGLGVILDVVYNHVGPEGNYLPLYGPYFTEKYKTPWGPALNYDDAHSDDVRRYVVDNALYWVTEYHVDGLRLDAIHGIFDFSPKHLVQEIAETVHAQGDGLGRRVVVIGESDLNDPRVVRGVKEHGYGLDAQWSDDFHHAVHAALTGETLGYYADFGDVEWIAAALREPFAYDGRWSHHRKRKHGGPSAGLPRERFVVAIQNHDQIGNRASGDRLSSTLTAEQFRLATALLLLSPYVSLLFMGQEYGETNPFQYFVSHGDDQLVQAVRDGRRKEFESFGWGDEVPDPQSAHTFRRSLLDRDKASHPEHAAILALHRDLLALRAAEPSLRPDGASIVVSFDVGVITLSRTPRDESGRAFVAIFNCADAEREVSLPSAVAGCWSLRFSTDARRYGGGERVSQPIEEEAVVGASAGAHGDWNGRGESASSTRRVTLPAWVAALYESSL